MEDLGVFLVASFCGDDEITWVVLLKIAIFASLSQDGLPPSLYSLQVDLRSPSAVCSVKTTFQHVLP